MTWNTSGSQAVTDLRQDLRNKISSRKTGYRSPCPPGEGLFFFPDQEFFFPDKKKSGSKKNGIKTIETRRRE
jgi:hypothetical protein